MPKLTVATLLFFLASPVRAGEHDRASDVFLAAHFTRDNDQINPIVDETDQTKDGFLWLIAAASHIYRFDGKTFYYFPTPLATTLAAAPDGDLWLGTATGLIHVRAADLDRFTVEGATVYPGPGKASQITKLRFGKSGVLWVGTADGLFRYDRGRFVAVGPRVATQQIEEAPDGRLLLITTTGFVEVDGAEVVPHAGLAGMLGVQERDIFHVRRDEHGATWYSTAQGLAREAGGRLETLGTFGPGGHAAYRTYEDSHGGVWVAKEEGLYLLSSGGLSLVSEHVQARSLFSDRENNVWVGTNGDGLYKFKERTIRTLTTEDGLPGNVLSTVIATHDGALWTGANCGGISRFDGTRFQTYSEKQGLANSCVWSLAEDAEHGLWIGTWGGGAFRFHDGAFTQYGKKQGLADDIVTNIVVARDGGVWFATPTGLSHLSNGQFRTFTSADGLSSDRIVRIFEDRSGIIWVGTRMGLDRLAGNRFEHVGNLPLLPAVIVPLGQDRNGALFVGAPVDARSAVCLLDKRGTTVYVDFEAFDMVETEGGEFWFAGGPIRRARAEAFAHARAHDEPLEYEPFSKADGLLSANVLGGIGPTAARTPDGKVWIATPAGLAMFDVPRLPITSATPSIYLTGVTIGRNKGRIAPDIVLAPGTNHVEVEFAAVEISAPEKIRMQYRLDDVDSEWLDAGTSRRAIYSKIPVGTHTLRIRACNRNGIWDRHGSTFSLTQQPYFYQTRWFDAAAVGSAILLLVVVYRIRVAQIARRLSASFDDRLAERTRVARELHDTFLQTVQGSKMVADHALKHSTDHDRMVAAMEQLSTWLARATEEGRAALNSLRASTTETNDLADAFRRAIEECRSTSDAEISFSTRGTFKKPHPMVRDEVYRIGYEAIRNACVHSKSDRLEVILEYGHDLTFSVRDNGIGIDPHVAESGRTGHFGLAGMRERAGRIGGTFTLVSAPGSGTAITLVVPGRVAFRSARPN